MLSEHEQRVLQELERYLADEAGTAGPVSPPARRWHRRHPANLARAVVGCPAGLARHPERLLEVAS
jgi:hypothetical protein